MDYVNAIINVLLISILIMNIGVIRISKRNHKKFRAVLDDQLKALIELNFKNLELETKNKALKEENKTLKRIIS